MKYELNYHGFVQQFGYEVWEILEDGVDFYNDNNISRAEYKDLLHTDPQKALLMYSIEFYENYKHIIKEI